MPSIVDAAAEHTVVLRLQFFHLALHLGALDGQVIVVAWRDLVRYPIGLVQVPFLFDKKLDTATEVLDAKAILALVIIDGADEIVEDGQSVVKVGKVEAMIISTWYGRSIGRRTGCWSWISRHDCTCTLIACMGYRGWDDLHACILATSADLFALSCTDILCCSCCCAAQV